jgi:O-antigen biosynthesis protein
MTSARQALEPILAPSSSVDGVVVVGMYASGVEEMGGSIAAMGMEPLASPRLFELNRSMIASVASSDRAAPQCALPELVRTLWPFADQARDGVADVVEASAETRIAPWLWPDPRLSFVAPFWADVLNVRLAVIFVHREPSEVVDLLAGDEEAAEAISQWGHYNRAGLVLCSELPSFVVSYSDLVDRPKEVLFDARDFLAGLGVALAGQVEQGLSYLDTNASAPRPSRFGLEIRPRDRTLDRLLGAYDGVRTRGLTLEHDLIQVTADYYDEAYYGTTYDRSGVPYSRDEQTWVDFFDGVASNIVASLRPTSALDVGCGIGLLVEALRERDVDAKGIDISAWAIEQIPKNLRRFCSVASATDEIDGRFDLITCTEVLEHLPPSLADVAVSNLCRHAETIFFASTPDDFDEPTHLNVEPRSYWVRLFLRHGFVHDVGYDATYLAPHAMLFRRVVLDLESLVASYEDALWDEVTRLGDLHEQHQKLTDKHHELALSAKGASDVLTVLEDQVEELDLLRKSAEERRAAETLAAYQAVRSYEADQRRLSAALAVREVELNAVYGTKVFRYSHKFRSFYGRLRGRTVSSGLTPVPPVAPVFPADGTYETWIDLFDTLDEGTREDIRRDVAELRSRPKFSVLMPVFNPPILLLRAAIESVVGQLYNDWELCIADDCSTDPEVARVLEKAAAADPRIKVVRRAENGHISAASNSALELATGEWVALLDHDDLLAEHALALMALAIGQHPEAGMVYSDEDKIDERGIRRDPFFKPDFDPLLLLGQNFVSHFSAFRKDLVDRVGGYRIGFEGSQDWDISLRVSELLFLEQVLHIPHVLYHWRVHASSTASLVSAKPYAVDAGRRAVADHLVRTGHRGRVLRIGKSGHNRVVWEPPVEAPRVSIVIPTRDGRLLDRCIDSILSLTQYPDFEIVVVDNGSQSLATLQRLQSLDDRLTVFRDARPFNYPALNNAAIRRTSGDLVCLLNDDTEVINGDWLTEMVTQVLQPGVGGVGAKLYYNESKIQHGGVTLGVYNVAGHAFRMFDRLSPGYFGNLQLARRTSAVTAACMLVRREAWEQIGGMDEVNLPVAFNDVDLCLRLRAAGWEIVWTPYAELYHHESLSRGPDTVGERADDFKQEVAYVEARWGFEALRRDKYYNPNLTLDAEDYSLAWPPRVHLIKAF